MQFDEAWTTCGVLFLRFRILYSIPNGEKRTLKLSADSDVKQSLELTGTSDKTYTALAPAE